MPPGFHLPSSRGPIGAPAYRIVPRLRAFWTHAGNAPGAAHIVESSSPASPRGRPPQLTQGADMKFRKSLLVALCVGTFGGLGPDDGKCRSPGVTSTRLHLRCVLKRSPRRAGAISGCPDIGKAEAIGMSGMPGTGNASAGLPLRRRRPGSSATIAGTTSKRFAGTRRDRRPRRRPELDRPRAEQSYAVLVRVTAAAVLNRRPAARSTCRRAFSVGLHFA